MTERAQQISAFLAKAGWADAERGILAADASFRRYDRLVRGEERAVLMDAPPPRENVSAFHRIQRLLNDLGFSAPRSFAIDETAGLILLEDLGDETFTRALAKGADESALYRLATDLLIALHGAFAVADAKSGTIPPYDDRRLLDEACLFTDWYLPALRGAETAPDAREVTGLIALIRAIPSRTSGRKASRRGNGCSTNAMCWNISPTSAL